jgi:hypothetical protein
MLIFFIVTAFAVRAAKDSGDFHAMSIISEQRGKGVRRPPCSSFPPSRLGIVKKCIGATVITGRLDKARRNTAQSK